ncbi:hypothetical protein BDZ45DRAFT_744240 [Acephala macrosclerotiorum]|nr:hypothetical protein BDZ45DRAFT_744240 [Acephala macrosclerotiorum]
MAKEPLLAPTLGTGGVRDPSIINGGAEVGKKWYIVSTDLNVGKTTWDVSQRKGQYLVHWASKFYSSSDTSHKGSPGPGMICYAYTISAVPTLIIDLCILPLPSISPQSYIRFLKNESSRPGGKGSYIRSGVKGPYTWLDNVVLGKVDLLLDYFGGDGYRGFVGSLNGTSEGRIGGLTNGNCVEADKSTRLTGLRHGSVVGVTTAL